MHVRTAQVEQQAGVSVVDLEFWKGGFQYAIKVRI